MDTIAAISTPPGRSGLGIVRISGDRARNIAARILRFHPGHEWKPWGSALADLVDDNSNAVDHVVVSFYASPRSYTSEDLIEISCHGSPIVLRFCLDRACAAGALAASRFGAQTSLPTAEEVDALL